MVVYWTVDPFQSPLRNYRDQKLSPHVHTISAAPRFKNEIGALVTFRGVYQYRPGWAIAHTDDATGGGVPRLDAADGAGFISSTATSWW